ncbi:MAG: hypothetical protein QE487_03980 [Fluviicola sp.]|nr:hypothetical protein [Fluviicola sp.]
MIGQSTDKVLHTGLDLEFAQEQIVELTKLLYQQNEFLENLVILIKEFVPTGDEHHKTSFNHILLLLQHEINQQNERKLYVDQFRLVNSSFIKKLNNLYPSLSKGEIDLVKLIRIGMDTKGIAAFKTVEPSSIKTAKYRLKKRLGILPEESLTHFIVSL